MFLSIKFVIQNPATVFNKGSSLLFPGRGKERGLKWCVFLAEWVRGGLRHPYLGHKLVSTCLGPW